MLPDTITDDIDSTENDQIIKQSFVAFPMTGQTLYLNGVTLAEMRILFEERLEKGIWADELRPIVEEWANENTKTVTLIETNGGEN